MSIRDKGNRKKSEDGEKKKNHRLKYSVPQYYYCFLIVSHRFARTIIE